MLKKRRIVSNLTVFNRLLRVCAIFSLGCMVLTKVFLYNDRKNADKLDFMISSLEKEDKLLELELNLLTNPKRLEELYFKLHNKYFADSVELNYNQIKDLNNLYPYFYSRKGVSLEKTLASK